MKKLLFAIFTLSGFSGLIYESIWSHYLKLLLGHAAYAQVLVLAIFMGGMAGGAWIAARISQRLSNLLRAYALVEGLIGLAALVFHHGFVAVANQLFSNLLPVLGSPLLAQLVKWTLASLLVLPQSILLGMTFPLMSAGIIRRHPLGPGATLAMLYFTNSLGAAAGVLSSGFFLIEAVGLPGTVMTAGLINLGLAVTVWFLAARPETAVAETPNPGVSSPTPSPRLKLLLFGAAVTGAASFFYEIAWIRMLSLVLGSSTHSFELMLAAFILGLALGGLWIRRRIDRIPQPLAFLGYVQILMGVLAVSTLPCYDLSFDFMQWVLSGLAQSEAGYAGYVLANNLVALAVMLPATFCAGMTLPLMTYVLLQDRVGEGAIGRIYAANTLGAIAGVIAAVHLVMPELGVKGVLVLGAGGDIGLGLLLLQRASSPRQRRTFAAAGFAGVGLLGFMALTSSLDTRKLTSGVYRTGRAALPEQAEVFYHRDGKTATVSLINWAKRKTAILTNGKADASLVMVPGEGPARDEITMMMVAALALAQQPEARLIANIGLGSGLTSHTLLADDRLARVDSIEIEPLMIEAARLGFGERVRNTYLDPRSHLVTEDAKSYFANTGSIYDVIISEPSNPWVSGVASLFSREFYAIAKAHLRDGGILLQWLQGYETSPELIASVVAALSLHFEDYALYSTGEADLVLVAKTGGRLAPLDAALFRQPRLAAELERVSLHDLQDFHIRTLGQRAILEPLFASFGAPANSDYHPFLDVHAEQARFLKATLREIIHLGRLELPLLELLGAKPALRAPTRVSDYFDHGGAQLAVRAMGIRDEIAAGTPGPILGADRDYALLSAPQGCPEFSQLRIDALLAFTSKILAYLAPEELTPIWEYLGMGTCWANPDPEARAWWDLLRAVGAREAATMSQQAGWMLEQGFDHGIPERRRALLYAALTGHLALHQAVEARQVWERWSSGDRPELGLRLLVELAGWKQGASSPGQEVR